MHLLRLLRPGVLSLLAALLLSACQSGAPAATTPAGSTPAATQQAEDNGEIADFPESPPAPAAGKAVVHGTLLSDDKKQPMELNEAISVYLAPVKVSDNEQIKVAGLDKVTDPKSVVDNSGRFMFTDVAPGEYALAVVTPMSDFLIPDPAKSGQDLIIKVEADQTIDVGTVYGKEP